jgi:DNA-cytosine methyltransferase
MLTSLTKTLHLGKPQDRVLRCATLFSGGGGAECGLQMAGFEPIWGIEYDQVIAALYQLNFGHDPYGDLLTSDPRNFDRPDLLHASPSCPSFSGAKIGGVETELDQALSAKVCEFIEYLQPNWVTIENVPKYRTSRSCEQIIHTLIKLGYEWTYDVVDAADFGVAQNRSRYILRASKERIGFLPLAYFYTHAGKRIGWQSALLDIIPDLPDSTLTKNQQKWRDKSQFKGDIAIERIGYRKEKGCKIRPAAEPLWTIRAALGDDFHGGNRNQVIDICHGTLTKSLNARALARLQSFPDSYQLPPEFGANKLYRALGNAIPCILMERVADSLRYKSEKI